MNEPQLEPFDLARMFITDHYAHGTAGNSALKLRWWQDGFYFFDEGCYHDISDKEIKAELTEYLNSYEVALSTHKINLILLCLQRQTRTPRGTELNSWLDDVNGANVVSAANGNVSFTDRDKDGKPRLLLHTPKYFSLTKLPYDYNPDAECPEWLLFLEDVMLGRQDYILLLQQWCGYLFMPGLTMQKFLLCTGEGANGKGVMFDVVQGLVGEMNCSQVGLSRFGNAFALSGMLGKIVNVTNESSHMIEDEAENVLKSLVAGDRFTFERKFKEGISAKPTAKIMIATNSLPRFNDKTQGIWRRILYCPFDLTIEENLQIRNKAEILKKELPGILNWAIEGLRLLREAGRFTVPEDNAALIEDYRRSADPARAFLLENYMWTANGAGVRCKDVYATYKTYCDENGCRPVGSRLFGKQVGRIFPEIERAKMGTRGAREYVYNGLVEVGVPCVP
ncbi:MAG: hypothetical protein ISS70_17705 [Phycisphaerae bacterium]|nr:hypothetical protein [Phycisphaerae bacterium]